MLRHTNERFFLLSSSEVSAQDACLQSLRTRQSARLVTSGLIWRAIGSTANTNAKAHNEPVAAGTTFYPFRQTYHRLAPHVTAEIDHDFRFAAPLVYDATEPSYVLCIGRYDKPDRIYDSISYIIGMQLSPAAQAQEDKDALVTIGGCTAGDLLLAQDMLAEIGAFAAAHALSAIDEDTLTFGPGEPLRGSTS